MVSNYGHQMLSSSKIMMLFLEGLDDCEEFPIIDVVILFCRREGCGMIGTWVEVTVGVLCMSIPPAAVNEASVMS